VSSALVGDLTTPSTPERAAGPPAPTPPRTVIEPTRGWRLVDVRELWRFRELLFFLCWRDVKVRYKQTVLGAAWAVLQPALLMVVFTIFFSRLGGLSSGDVPYPLFAFAGLLAWTFFATAVTTAGNSVVGSERLITKIYFPRLAIPFAAVGAAVVDFLCAMTLLAVLMAVYGYAPTWNLLAAPLIFAVIALMAAGLGTLLAALNVAYRDFRYVVPFLIQIGMFATPTIYMEPATGAATGSAAWWLALNPMTTLISGFRASVLGGELPWAGLGVATVWAVAMFLVGCLYFRRVEDGFADQI
jgi:homopolymeric O-antigen transport system permease protein